MLLKLTVLKSQIKHVIIHVYMIANALGFQLRDTKNHSETT